MIDKRVDGIEAALAGLASGAAVMVNGFGSLFSGLMSPSRQMIMDSRLMIDRFFAAVVDSLVHLGPLFLMLAIVGNALSGLRRKPVPVI